jgi:hypothetical protein
MQSPEPYRSKMTRDLADNGMGPALSILPSGSKFFAPQRGRIENMLPGSLLILARARDQSNIVAYASFLRLIDYSVPCPALTSSKVSDDN